MCDLSRGAGAAENQKKQAMLHVRIDRDLFPAEADLRLDAQLDCASEERLRVKDGCGSGGGGGEEGVVRVRDACGQCTMIQRCGDSLYIEPFTGDW